ncbi:hypothetical protein G9F72_013610 [Clostridium estertheticum]|uniref:hypothetical protein n=1 Tax=Clostridium estertheticum TaxID=238834 RepID=UPI0013E91BA4|nr:hypothetical protein [Clostridium estertheticum]MBZ9687363.1 hypothetical protein [Clostridium estertheticum]
MRRLQSTPAKPSRERVCNNGGLYWQSAAYALWERYYTEDFMLNGKEFERNYNVQKGKVGLVTQNVSCLK